jgi:glycosyltransferase involved in cell wall biosynthesis
MPKVSVLLPNLNNYPFLPERIQTILDQTLTDWELVVVDNHSDDGAWELFQSYAARDARIRISQAPREGMYANWNNCIRLARGEYVYIATSDDTMEPNCLEEMVKALEAHPECDLAHCNQRAIDHEGQPSSLFNWDHVAVHFAGLMEVKRANIRQAPYDGLIHCAEGGVYTSITQLLIRRSLFDRIGLFRTDYGSIADYEWTMRASLLVSTIHIPQYLATWRVHPSQATSFDNLRTLEHSRRMAQLMDYAFEQCKKINPDALRGIDIDPFRYARQRNIFDHDWKATREKWQKLRLLYTWWKVNPYLVKKVIRQLTADRPFKAAKVNPVECVKKNIHRLGLEKLVVLLDA